MRFMLRIKFGVRYVRYIVSGRDKDRVVRMVRVRFPLSIQWNVRGGSLSHQFIIFQYKEDTGTTF